MFAKLAAVVAVAYDAAAMTKMRFLILVAGLTSGSCTTSFFACNTTAQCNEVVGARCELTGFCSAPDSTCASGYRYVPNASSRLAGQCVANATDASVAAPPPANDLCVGSSRDPQNCGGCGIVCGSGEECIAAACACPAAVPDVCAGDGGTTCTNVQTDVDNCGTCGNACASGQLCQAGACVETCAASYTSCTSYCANETSDPSNCGACGAACSQNNVVNACTGGTCSGTCVPGFADCNGDLRTDGCEVNTLTDFENCNGCANECGLAANNSHGIACVNGQCTQRCNTGYVSCGTTCCAATVLFLVAGQLGGEGNLDGTGTGARFVYPGGITVDASGTIYLTDSAENTVRKISQSGVVTTIAGHAGVHGTVDATGTAALFYEPWGVAVDGSENVYVADTINYTLRMIAPNGSVTTLAGAPALMGTSDGVGTQAQFEGPGQIAFDGSSNLYVADSWTVRRVTTSGAVTTLAGMPGTFGELDGTGTAASFRGAFGIALTGGSLYVADQSNYNIRSVSLSGVVNTVAGVAGDRGTTDGFGVTALFYDPLDISADASGDLYVTDGFSGQIRLIKAGVVSTLAGTSPGYADGNFAVARFGDPEGIAIDATGNLYVGDNSNYAIRKISTANVVSTFAGLASHAGSANGIGTAAQFNGPAGVAVDATGNIYVADARSSTVREVTPTGLTTLYAGATASTGTTDGSIVLARFDQPQGIALDATGNIYVADTSNHTIRKISGGTVSTFAGVPAMSGTTDGAASTALFNSPIGITVDAQGNVFVADRNARSIREISNGVVSLVAGGGVGGTTDGIGSGARFSDPTGIAVDSAGNLYVSEGDTVIRRINAAGVVITLAGVASTSGTADGTGSAARFGLLGQVAVDAAGNVYVADTTNATVRKVTPSGVVTTVVGIAGVIGVAPGALPASLNEPYGIAVSGTSLIISDQQENAILRALNTSGF